MTLQRMTSATEQVLSILLATEAQTWGLSLMKETGLPSGTIYPMLARLESYGWIEATWDEQPGPGPRRRLYSITPSGREAVADAFASRAARTQRRTGRVVPAMP